MLLSEMQNGKLGIEKTEANQRVSEEVTEGLVVS